MLVEYTGQTITDGVVRLTAAWCQPCKSYAPIYDRVAGLLDADFYVIDIEAYPDIAQEHKVMSIPAVFRVVDGVWTKFEHVPSAPELRDAVT
jgi:thiol-disulfide isomerase/thioredoxin